MCATTLKLRKDFIKRQAKNGLVHFAQVLLKKGHKSDRENPLKKVRDHDKDCIAIILPHGKNGYVIKTDGKSCGFFTDSYRLVYKKLHLKTVVLKEQSVVPQEKLALGTKPIIDISRKVSRVQQKDHDSAKKVTNELKIGSESK